MRPLSILLLSIALGFTADSHAHDEIGEARYLGNEGVLVTFGETKVLFDAFYSDSYGTYLLVPAADRAAMLRGAPPYDGITAVFVSHVHGDHFTAKPTLDYLRAHPGVRLHGPQQVADALAAEVAADDPVLARIVAYDLQPGDSARASSADGLDIDAVAIPHAGGVRMQNVRNLVFRVTLNESTTVMHLGDSAANRDAFAAQRSHWAAKRIAAAFPPYWFLEDPDGLAILNEHIDADHVIGIHVPAEAVGQGEAWRTRAGGDLFTDPGESRQLNHTHAAAAGQ